MSIKRKNNLRMEIKEISADGSFTGMLSVYNVVDLGKDLVEPGAFTKTIKDHGNEVPMLWQHKSDVPIGTLTLEDGPDALHVKGQLLMELPEAKKAYLLIKARIVRGLSIGFDTVKEVLDGGIRRLKELRLYEGSIVTFPMNEAAQITSVKHLAERKEDFSTELAELQLQDAGYQMWCALRNALCSIPWSGLSREEKLSAAAATLEQFTAAWMDYLPAYLDWLLILDNRWQRDSDGHHDLQCCGHQHQRYRHGSECNRYGEHPAGCHQHHTCQRFRAIAEPRNREVRWDDHDHQYGRHHHYGSAVCVLHVAHGCNSAESADLWWSSVSPAGSHWRTGSGGYKRLGGSYFHRSNQCAHRLHHHAVGY